MAENVKEFNIFALAMDPVYIGTGGYTIGRVDNTIVRDPITNVPKIPGSSLAGTWRYYVVLETLKDIKDKQPSWEKIKESPGETIGEKIKETPWKEPVKDIKKWKLFDGNKVMKITCAGQDNLPQVSYEEAPEKKNGKTGHCGHCIVCKGFGFTKKDLSWQGQIFFSDLNIILFPILTMKGTKWITTERIIEEIVRELEDSTKKTEESPSENRHVVYMIKENGENGTEEEKYINLGWLYLPYEELNQESGLYEALKKMLDKLKSESLLELALEDIVIVPEDLFSHIVNSNLEVRTSVSIDPITGAAKEGALFTSEAIPRGTIFHGKIRIFDKSVYQEIEKRLQPLPDADLLINALNDSRHYYETLGIGGMTTRGFGRLKISELTEPGKSGTNGGNNE